MYVCMCVATIKPHPLTHPYLVNNVHLVAKEPHAKFQQIGPLIIFLTGQITSCECGNYENTPMLLITLTHALNNTHPVTWRSHAKFKPDNFSKNIFLTVRGGGGGGGGLLQPPPKFITGGGPSEHLFFSNALH